MANTTWYGDGTATVAAGSRTVSGTDTGWLTEVAGLTPIKAGDKFGIHVGRPIVIEAIVSDTELLLADDWPGPAQTDAPYKVELTSPTIAAVEAMRRLLASLSNGNLESLSEISVGTDDIPIGIGPGVFSTINKAALVQGVQYNAWVANLAGRAAYNGAPAGFAVLVIDIGDGRSALYFKNSATSGDWSAPSYVTGPVGPGGPYTEITIGPTTTLPAGSSATVTPVVIDADTVRLDFGLPKGLDGTGTGDVVGPSSSIDGQFAVANGATGKSIKFLTQAAARQSLGGFEFISAQSLAGVSLVDWTNLDAFIALKLFVSAVQGGTPGTPFIRFSSNNGSSFDSGASDYVSSVIVKEGTAFGATADANTSFFPLSNVVPSANTGSIYELEVANFNKAVVAYAKSDGLNQNAAGSAMRRELFIGYRLASVARNALRLGISSPWGSGRAALFGLRG